jgi:Gpi18-like mannosyltransferase
MAKVYFAKMKTSSICKLLLLALMVRLFLIYFQYSGDVLNHLAWGRGTLEGLLGFYNKDFPGFNSPNYPPLTIYLFAFSSWLYQIVNQLIIFLNQSIKIFPSTLVPAMETLNMQAAFLKLPAIFADLGIGWLIYRLSSKTLLSALYLFNPAVIYISTIWGQIESIPIFFILLSLYFAINVKGRTLDMFLSHVFFTLAILSKQTALWLLPIFLVLWLKNRPFKTLLQGLTLQVAIFILLYLPFTHGLTQPFTIYLKTLAGSSSLVSDAAWNIWHFIYPISTQDSIILLGLPVRIWSISLLTISITYITYQFAKQKLNLYQSLFWLSMVAFFIQTRVHERHLFPALVFFLLAYKPSWRMITGFLTLTLFHLFNLYWSLGLLFI